MGFDMLMCLYTHLQDGVQVGCQLPHWRYTIAFNVTSESILLTLIIFSRPGFPSSMAFQRAHIAAHGLVLTIPSPEEQIVQPRELW